MQLFAAALQEELNQALELCPCPAKVSMGRFRLWQSIREGKEILFLKTGVGPRASGERLRQVLEEVRPEKILVFGYAGALDPSLKLGDLVLGRSASIFGESPARRPLDEEQLAATFELSGADTLLEAARSAGLSAVTGQILTSPYIIGDPVQKSILFRRFNASAIDMETASLARSALEKGVAIEAVRTISDTAVDEFLAPFSFDPEVGPVGRAARVVKAGSWVERFRDWRGRAAAARATLKLFLRAYLEGESVSRRC